MTESRPALMRLRQSWTLSGPVGRVRLVLGGAFATASFALCATGALSVMGDTFPSHVGASKAANGAAVIHFALCPGESVTSVAVDWGDGHRWRATSPGAALDEWTVGEPLPAPFRLDEEPTGQDPTVGSVTVSIRTNKARWGDEFTVEELARSAVVFDGESVAPSEFRSLALSRYPCNDPDGRKAAWHLSVRLLILGLVAAVLAAGALQPIRRSRPAPPN